MIVRTIKRNKKTCTIMDMKGRKATLEINDIKNRIIMNQVEVIDMQIIKDGRLVSKKVDFRDLYKHVEFHNEEHGALSIKEQQLILFYGLARINQITIQAKKKLFEKIEALHSIDEENLKSIFTDNENWDYNKYSSLDTGCRDKVIGLIYYIAGSSNNEHCLFKQ